MDGTPDLRKFIKAIAPDLSEECMTSFLSIWKTEHFKRKEVLTYSGEVEGKLYFVLEGVQRIYHIDDKAREATLLFSYPYSFSGIVDSFFLREASSYYFETLTKSRMLSCSYRQLFGLMEEHAALKYLIHKQSLHAVKGFLHRMVELQTFSSEEKFRSLLKRSPHILQLVPQKYLANYLGMDETNFSKLMHKVRI